MKILLIDPPMQSIMLARADWYPMSLSYLAGSAIAEGHDVLIYNGEHYKDLDYVISNNIVHEDGRSINVKRCIVVGRVLCI